MFLRYVDPARKVPQDFPIRKPILSIGRAPGCDIVLPDPGVAPTHANVLRKPNHLTIAVVDRALELHVNGRRVRRADVRPGDRILLGRHELTVHEGEPALVPRADDLPVDLQVRAIERLVALSERLMSETSPEAAFEALLGTVVELTSAEKGFVIAIRDGERRLAASHNVEDAADPSRISDSIVETVVQTGQPLIVSDAVRDPRFREARSVVDLRLSSVMCVPLKVRNHLLGVLYLGNDSVTDLFDSGDLALLQVFAAEASLLLHMALALNELQDTNRSLKAELRRLTQGEMLGGSAPMKALFKAIRRVAPTDLSVLIQGETGTGKELVAREIHRLSDRREGPFVSINCGAIPEHLLESELFGHRRGAFTGATEDRPGRFQLAEGGTLFLDEIGEMPAPLQVKLLRVLQDRIVERVGDTKGRPVDFRLLSATNKDLETEVREGRFREDLFYRLNEVTLQVPPLRERGEDIEELAWHLLRRYAAQYGSRVRGFDKAALQAMRRYYWPGNVRQLENRVKRAVILSDRTRLTPADLGLRPGDRRPVQPLAEAEEAFKIRYIREVLEMNNWNKAQTARDLGVDPRTIFRYIEKMGD